MTDSGKPSNGNNEQDRVRIVKRTELEIDLRDGVDKNSDHKPARRSPWRDHLADIATSSPNRLSVHSVRKDERPRTPFLRPLRKATLEDEFGDLDIGNYESYKERPLTQEPGIKNKKVAGADRATPKKVTPSVDSVPKQESLNFNESASPNPSPSDKPIQNEEKIEQVGKLADVKEIAEENKGGSGLWRIVTGLAIAGLAIAAFASGARSVLVAAAIVLVIAAAEFYATVRNVGYRPATALGLVAVVVMLFGTYARGDQAIPIVLMLTIAFCFLWFVTGVARVSPTQNIAVTLLGVLWIGLLGSFSALILRAPDDIGVVVLFSVALMVAVNDTVAYFVGSRIGKTKLAGSISPGKTVEGTIAGSIATLLIAIFVLPWFAAFSLPSAMVMGIVVSVFAPIGDLSESVIKRDLKVKDMGSILPGHGGLLDRIDGLLLTLPAAYFAAQLMGVLQG